MKSMKWINRIVGVLLITVVVTVAGRYWWANRPLPFDAHQWQNAHNVEEYEARYRMMPSVRKLIDSGSLRTDHYFEQALGPPDQGSKRYWLYNLAPEHNSFVRIDNDWLELVFDESGTLLSHRVRPD